MGGGTILILLLSIFLGLNQHTAQATNLVFFIPTAVTSVFIGIKSCVDDVEREWESTGEYAADGRRKETYERNF